MRQRDLEILLVEDDGELAAMIVGQLQSAVSARVTHACGGREGLSEELTFRHDLVIVSSGIESPGWAEFMRGLRSGSEAPAVLLADELSVDDAVQALRLGVVDVLHKPFDLSDLTAIAIRHARREVRRKRDCARARRLRKITSRIVEERRDLHQRLDLICRDFVQAYKRLAEKVTQSGMLACEEE